MSHSEIDRAYTRMVLGNAGIRLHPLEKGHYAICKVCGAEFKSSDIYGYIEHVRREHPERVSKAKQALSLQEIRELDAEREADRIDIGLSPAEVRKD